MPNRYYDEYHMPGRRMNIDKGLEIYPEAIYDIAINIRDNYNNIPCLSLKMVWEFLARNASWIKTVKSKTTTALISSKNTLLAFTVVSKKVQIALVTIFGH